MASFSWLIIVGVLVASSWSGRVLAADPDPLQDFCVTHPVQAQHVFFNGLPCKNPAAVTPADFKSELLRKPGGNVSASPFGVAVAVAAGATFGALNTQGLTMARIDLAKDGILPPHVHARATEVFLLVKGAVSVGFVDTNNMLFSQTLYPGDLFVFPRGLVHYIYNVGRGPALAYAALNSQNPGVALLNLQLFGTKPPIPAIVLEKSFLLNKDQVQDLQKIFGS